MTFGVIVGKEDGERKERRANFSSHPYHSVLETTSHAVKLVRIQSMVLLLLTWFQSKLPLKSECYLPNKKMGRTLMSQRSNPARLTNQYNAGQVWYSSPPPYFLTRTSPLSLRIYFHSLYAL